MTPDDLPNTTALAGMGAFLQPMAHARSAEWDAPVTIVSGEGVYVRDAAGRRLVDGVGGLWNMNLGYSNAVVKQAVKDQLDLLPYYSSIEGTTHPAAPQLAQQIVELLGDEGVSRVFFNSGGSDAVETALKLARQYWKLVGEPTRTKFISLKYGYHGVHFGGASVNGVPAFRASYEPMLPGCFHIETPWTFRNPFTEEPEELARICANLLEREILFQTPGTVAALIAEPIQGAGGVIVPPANFWPLLREVCDRHGVLLIADEVVTGFGRSGAMTGSRGWGVKPDLMCFAKGITSGYVPFGATTLNERVATAFANSPDPQGHVMHGYTYSAHPLGCAAAIAALQEVVRLDLPRLAATRGRYMIDRLKPLQDRYDLVGEVRGKGLMICIDLVADKKARTPLAPDSRTTRDVARHAASKGALVRAVGNNIILSPPLIIDEQEIDIIVEALEDAFKVYG
jgi:adenosylmethionine-8-amino-7-oxononanoate aminotransferase